MRSEQLSLMELSRDAVFEARVQWGPLPSWGRAEERSRRSSNSKHQSDRSSSAARSTTPTSEFKGIYIFIKSFLCVCILIITYYLILLYV